MKSSNTEYFKLLQHIDEVRKSIDRKGQCLISLRQECTGKVIDSHSIASTNLDLIADARHVKHIAYNGFVRDAPIVIESISVNKASTFRAMCNAHDASLFRSIDAAQPEVSAFNASLHHYRSLCYEMYAKISTLTVFKSYDFVGEAQNDKKWFQEGIQLGARDLSHAFFHHTGEVLQGKDAGIRFLAFELSPRLPFSYLCFVNLNAFPQYGLPPPTQDEYSPSISIAVIPTQLGSQLLITWEPAASRAVKAFARRLQMAKGALPEILLQFGLEHCENLFFNPSWIDAASKFHAAMKELMRQNIIEDFSNIGHRALRGIVDNRYSVSRRTTNSLQARLWLKDNSIR